MSLLNTIIPMSDEPNTELVEASVAMIVRAMRSSRNPVLQFSGGKDSLACLYLLRPYWSCLTVMWANAGDSYPETAKLMQEVAGLVGRFLEIRGNALEHIRKHGSTSDMPPLRNMIFGRAVEPSNQIALQSAYDCCTNNFWLPAENAVKQHGFDLVIRGQRANEAKRTPVTNGQEYLGFSRILMPIEQWKKEDVFTYLRSENVQIPRQYAYGLPSLDCLHCTAYLSESRSKLKYLKDHHPGAVLEYESRLQQIEAAQEEGLHMTKLALGKVQPYGHEGVGD